MERENEKDSSPPRRARPTLTTPRTEGSSQNPSPPRVEPPFFLPPSQGGYYPGAPLGGMPPANLPAIPVDGSAHGSAGGPNFNVGGFLPQGADRKVISNVPSDGSGAAAVAGGEEVPLQCSLCRRRFYNSKSLFGHMRIHRARGWTGALPPPVFSRQEFADTGLLNPEPEHDDEPEQDEGGTGVGAEEATNVNVEYTVPDLNLSPPREEDGNESDD